VDELIAILQKIPSNAWTAIVTAILSSGLTLIGVWFTNRANNQRLKIQFEHEQKIQNETFLRERLEELFIISNKYFHTLVMHYLPFRMVMRGEITFNKALDMTIGWGREREYNPDRVRMLLNMYFPELLPEFNKILDLREKLNDIVHGFKEQYKSGNLDGSKWLEIFSPLFEKLGTLTTEFDKHVVKLKSWDTILSQG